MTWHSLSSSLAWHKEQILTCLRVLGTVYLPVSMRSRWFPRLNLLIADIWRGFFIASRNSVLLVSVLKLKYCKNLDSCSRQDWRVGGWLKLWTDFERHWRWGFYRCFHLKSWSVNYIITYCFNLLWYVWLVFLVQILESCKQCFAILSSGRFCKWIQYFKILISMDNFKDNFPSSFLAATFGHCWLIVCFLLMTVYKLRKICVFSMISFSQLVKSSLS